MTLPEVHDPVRLFDEWLRGAEGAGLKYPNAAALATVDDADMPDVRMVLLKGVDHHGFVFYTNLESAKGRQLDENPRAALCFYWESLGRQVRIRGTVELVTPEEADEYFASRPRQSRIGAWASHQSRTLASREELETRYLKLEAEFGEDAIPRPPHWSGYRLLPVEIEFWEEGDWRLHNRRRYTRSGDTWTSELLNP